MNDLLKVGIAEMTVARVEEGAITYALGSCVGICLYDSAAKIAGMVHVMLPEPSRGQADKVAKYATTGIPALIQKMVAAGASKSRLTAKIAGGAKMFQMSGTSSIGDIGRRNVEITKAILRQEGIRLVAEDCGADYARTMTIFRENGSVLVKSYAKGEKYL